MLVEYEKGKGKRYAINILEAAGHWSSTKLGGIRTRREKILQVKDVGREVCRIIHQGGQGRRRVKWRREHFLKKPSSHSCGQI